MLHPEPVLLVHDEQAEVLELDILLQEPVGPHDEVDPALLHELDRTRLLLLRPEPGQHLDRHGIVTEPLREGLVVLLREDGGGHEEGDLLVVDHRLEGGPDSHLGLAETHVAAYHAVHGPLPHQVVEHLPDDPLLSVRLLVLEPLLHLPEQLVIGRECVPLGQLRAPRRTGSAPWRYPRRIS